MASLSESQRIRRRTVWLEGSVLCLLDQRALPHRKVILRLESHRQSTQAIRDMAVRGAGTIGAAGAFAMAQAALTAPADRFQEEIKEAQRMVTSARPTAKNLSYGVERVVRAVRAARGANRADHSLHPVGKVLGGRPGARHHPLRLLDLLLEAIRRGGQRRLGHGECAGGPDGPCPAHRHVADRLGGLPVRFQAQDHLSVRQGPLIQEAQHRPLQPDRAPADPLALTQTRHTAPLAPEPPPRRPGWWCLRGPSPPRCPAAGAA